MGSERQKHTEFGATPNHLMADFGEESPNNHRAGAVFDRKIGVTRQSERSEA
jgi:hypothetical protein